MTLAYLRIDESAISNAWLIENLVAIICSLQLAIFWTNMSIRTLKWLSRAAFLLLGTLFLLMIA